MPQPPVLTGMPDGSQVVQLSGEIDVLTAPQICQCLDTVTASPRPRIVVDLREVTFIDCRGLSVLVRARRRIRENGGRLCLVVDNPRILWTLRKTELIQHFSLYSDLPRALAAVTRGLAQWRFSSG